MCHEMKPRERASPCWAGSARTPGTRTHGTTSSGWYEPKILHWCRGWGLQESDARDVTQDVLLKLQGLLAKFAYDPSRSFRGWLRTLTHHARRDLVDDRKRTGFASGDTAMQGFFENITAGDTLVQQLQEEFRKELLDQAPRGRARTEG